MEDYVEITPNELCACYVLLNILKQFPVFWEKGGAKAPNQGMRRF